MSQEPEHLPKFIPQLEQGLPPELIAQTLSRVKRAFGDMVWERNQRSAGIMPTARIESHRDTPDIAFTWDDAGMDTDGINRSIHAVLLQDSIETETPSLSIQINAWKDQVESGRLVERKWQNVEVLRSRLPVINTRLLVEAMHEAYQTVHGLKAHDLLRAYAPKL